MSKCRCCPMWGNTGKGLWLLLSCNIKGRRWLLRSLLSKYIVGMVWETALKLSRSFEKTFCDNLIEPVVIKNKDYTINLSILRSFLTRVIKISLWIVNLWSSVLSVIIPKLTGSNIQFYWWWTVFLLSINFKKST